MTAMRTRTTNHLGVWMVLIGGGFFLAGCSKAPESASESASEMVMRSDSIPAPETSLRPETVIDESAFNESARNESSIPTEPAMPAPPTMPGPSAMRASPTMPIRAPMSAAPAPTASAARTAAPMRADAAFATQPAEALAMDQPAFVRPDPIDPLAAETQPTANTPEGFREVDVYYATDRAADALPLSAYHLSGQRQLLGYLGMAGLVTACMLVLSWLVGRTATSKFSTACLVAIGGAAAFVVVNRSVGIEKHGVGYTGDRGKLVRGVCTVTVPDTHTRGNVERPTWMRVEFAEDQQKHIVLTEVAEMPTTAFDQRLATSLASTPRQDLLVFIHGYNVTFESAVHRTAQIAVDLPFEGVPVCYSWPSQGSLLGYPVDENNVAWSVGHLREFLTDLMHTHSDASIHVVAHSMGNRAMTAALQQMSLQRVDTRPPLRSVVLAAPDVDADLFRKDLAPALMSMANQVTLYASSDDQALIASKQVHGYPRAGESGPQLVVIPGVETVDVSGIDLSLLGHSYYGDSEWMLQDLREVVAAGLPARQRSSLIPRSYQSMVYYQLAQRSAAQRVATPESFGRGSNHATVTDR